MNTKEKKVLALIILMVAVSFYNTAERCISVSQVYKYVYGDNNELGYQKSIGKNEVQGGWNEDKNVTIFSARGEPEYLNHINLMTAYDIIPQNLEIRRGNLHYGARKYLHRSDGKSIIIASDAVDSYKHMIELVMYYNITNTSNVPHSYYMSIVADNYVNISIYEQNPVDGNDYVLIHNSSNVSELTVNTTIPYVNTQSVAIKIIVLSNMSFNIEIGSAILIVKSLYITCLLYTSPSPRDRG